MYFLGSPKNFHEHVGDKSVWELHFDHIGTVTSVIRVLCLPGPVYFVKENMRVGFCFPVLPPKIVGD